MTALRLLLTLITVLALALVLAIYTLGPAALETAQNRVAGDKVEAPSADRGTAPVTRYSGPARRHVALVPIHAGALR